MSDFQIQGQLLQKLYAEGSLVLLHLYKSGTLLDFSGNGNHGVGTDIVFSGGKVRFPLAATSKIVVADNVGLQSLTGSLVGTGDFVDSISNDKRFLSKRDGGGTHYDIKLDAAPQIEFYNGSITVTLAGSINGKTYLGINYDSGQIPQGYLEGLFEGAYSGVSTITANDADLVIGNYFVGTAPFGGSLESVVITNVQLTESEHSQLRAELDAIQFPTTTNLVSNAHLLVDPRTTYGPEVLADRLMEQAGTAAYTPSSGATLSKESVSPHSGTQNLRITWVSGGALARQYVLTLGLPYRVRGWARGDGVNGFPKVHTGSYVWTGTTSTSWQSFDVDVVAGATEIRFYNGYGGAGYCEFDDCSVTEVHELTAGYNMRPVDGEIIDQSSKRHDLITVTSHYEDHWLGDVQVFSGGQTVMTAALPYLNADFGAGCTVSMWIIPGTTTGDVLNIQGRLRLKFVGNKLNAEVYDGTAAWQIAQSTLALTVGVPYYVVATFEPSGAVRIYLNSVLQSVEDTMTTFNVEVAGRPLALGSDYAGANFATLKMAAPSIIADVKDQTWVTKEYRRGLAACWKTDWGVTESVAAITEGNLENSPFMVDSGSFKISTEAIGDGPLGNELLTDGDMEAGPGPEEMTDGDMEAVGTAAYSAGNSATLTKEVGTPYEGLQCLRVARNAAANPYAYQGALIAGRSYRVTGRVRSDGNATPAVKIGGSSASWNGTTSTSWQVFDFFGVAGGINMIYQGLTNTGTEYVEFDICTVVETCPDWTALRPGLLTKETADPYSGLQNIKIAYTATNKPGAYQTNILVVGKIYRVTGKARSGGASTPVVGDWVGNKWIGTWSTSWQNIDVTFEAGHTTFLLMNYTNGAGYVEFDDISVKEVIPDKKVIECVTAGICYIPTAYFRQTETEAAFGYCKFWIYKELDAAELRVYINASVVGALADGDMDAYLIRFQNDESILFNKRTAGAGAALFDTAASVFNIEQWYEVEITRTPDGEFSVYLDGTLISVASGANPVTDTVHTTAKYFMLDLDQGDRVAYSDRHGNYSIVKGLLTP